MTESFDIDQREPPLKIKRPWLFGGIPEYIIKSAIGTDNATYIPDPSGGLDVYKFSDLNTDVTARYMNGRKSDWATPIEIGFRRIGTQNLSPPLTGALIDRNSGSILGPPHIQTSNLTFLGGNNGDTGKILSTLGAQKDRSMRFEIPLGGNRLAKYYYEGDKGGYKFHLKGFFAGGNEGIQTVNKYRGSRFEKSLNTVGVSVPLELDASRLLSNLSFPIDIPPDVLARLTNGNPNYAPVDYMNYIGAEFA